MLNASPMSIRRRNRTIGTLCLAAMSGLAFLLASGCGSSEAAQAPGQAAGTQVAAASKYDKDQYLVEMKPDGACTVGKECKAVITLKSKGEFHINDKYPIKFKAQDPAPEGVTFTKTLVKRDEGKFAEKEGTLPVAFTLAKAGKSKIAGQFAFSVCSDANCVMDKVDLEVEVEAK